MKDSEGISQTLFPMMSPPPCLRDLHMAAGRARGLLPAPARARKSADGARHGPGNGGHCTLYCSVLCSTQHSRGGQREQVWPCQGGRELGLLIDN